MNAGPARPRNGMASNGVSSHILPTSATMVGVCMTVISIGKIAHGHAGMVIDRMLAVDSALFLLSALLSFLSIRSIRSAMRLERWAENLFLVALGLVSVTSVVLAFEIL